VSEFHAEAPQATVMEGHAQGHYVAARAGFATLWTEGAISINEPPCPTSPEEKQQIDPGARMERRVMRKLLGGE